MNLRCGEILTWSALPIVIAAGMCLLAVLGCDRLESTVDNRGFLAKTHTDTGRIDRRYVLFVPDDLDRREKLPVILFLNGFGENGGDGLRQISNNFGVNVWRMRERFPFIAVCPQCSGGGRWSGDSPDTGRALVS